MVYENFGGQCIMEADETHKLAAALNVSDKIIFVHVLQIGKVKKLDESSTDNQLCSIARLRCS